MSDLRGIYWLSFFLNFSRNNLNFQYRWSGGVLSLQSMSWNGIMRVTSDSDFVADALTMSEKCRLSGILSSMTIL